MIQLTRTEVGPEHKRETPKMVFLHETRKVVVPAPRNQSSGTTASARAQIETSEQMLADADRMRAEAEVRRAEAMKAKAETLELLVRSLTAMGYSPEAIRSMIAESDGAFSKLMDLAQRGVLKDIQQKKRRRQKGPGLRG